jgi:hypothetical protein
VSFSSYSPEVFNERDAFTPEIGGFAVVVAISNALVFLPRTTKPIFHRFFYSRPPFSSRNVQFSQRMGIDYLRTLIDLKELGRGRNTVVLANIADNP